MTDVAAVASAYRRRIEASVDLPAAARAGRSATQPSNNSRNQGKLGKIFKTGGHRRIPASAVEAYKATRMTRSP